MAKRTFGQYCGLARALEMVGERWALLIVRDLLVGARRFTDLKQGLPRIPTNILSARLKELEQAGVVERRTLPRPAGGVVYELTGYGQQLEEVVVRLGRWGAQRLGEPGPDEVITAESLTMAMRSTFRPEAARGRGVSYELRLGGTVVHARVGRGRVDVAPGELPEADLVIESGPAIRALMAGELAPEDALAAGTVRVKGDPALLSRFTETFRI